MLASFNTSFLIHSRFLLIYDRLLLMSLLIHDRLLLMCNRSLLTHDTDSCWASMCVCVCVCECADAWCRCQRAASQAPQRWVCVCVCTKTQTQEHTHTNTYTHTYKSYTHAHMHTYTYTQCDARSISGVKQGGLHMCRYHKTYTQLSCYDHSIYTCCDHSIYNIWYVCITICMQGRARRIWGVC